MVDVWAPVAEVVERNNLMKKKLNNLLKQQKVGGEKGRASYLGERAIGHIDPGAASSALLFEELVKVINQ